MDNMKLSSLENRVTQKNVNRMCQIFPSVHTMEILKWNVVGCYLRFNLSTVCQLVRKDHHLGTQKTCP